MDRRRRSSSSIFPILALGLTAVTAWMAFDSGSDSWQALSARPRTTAQETVLEMPSPESPPAQPAASPAASAADPMRDSLREAPPPTPRTPSAPRGPAAAVAQAFSTAKVKAAPVPRASYSLSGELTPLESESTAGTSASYAPIVFDNQADGGSGSDYGAAVGRTREPSDSHNQDPYAVDYAPMAVEAALPELAAASEEAGGEDAGGDEGGGGDDGGGGGDDGGGGGGGGGDDGGGGLGDAWELEGLEDGEPWEFEPGGYELPDSTGGDDSGSADGPRRRRNLPPECRKRSRKGGIAAVFRDFFKCLRALRKQAREEQAAAAIARMDPMCRRGRISPERCGRSLGWYREQAAHGDPGSHFMVGTGYAQGREVPQDRVESYAWYLRGGQLGHTPSQEILGMMEPRMTPEMIAQARQRAEQLGGRPASTAKASTPPVEPQTPEAPKTPAKPSRPRLTTTLTPI